MNKKLLSLGSIGVLYAVSLGGCAHGKLGNVEQALDRKAITKTTPIFVEPVSGQNIAVSGDAAKDAAKSNEERITIEAQYHKRIAQELRKLGYNAKAVDAPVKSGLALAGNVTKLEHGSAAARMFVGMGAGSANMFTNFMFEDRTAKKRLSQFEIIATSGGEGGLAATRSFMEKHLDDGAEKTAQYIAGTED